MDTRRLIQRKGPSSMVEIGRSVGQSVGRSVGHLGNGWSDGPKAEASRDEQMHFVSVWGMGLVIMKWALS